jgi:hypothetical protein
MVQTSAELLAELHQHVDAMGAISLLLEESPREDLLQHLDLMVENFTALLKIARNTAPPLRGEG